MKDSYTHYNNPVLHGPIEPAQYVGLRYTDRLTELGIRASVGTAGDSYDNALAEAVNAAYKSELIVSGRPWRTVEQVELATMDWVWWFNHHRLHQQLGYRTPVEYEAAHTGTSHHASRPIPAPAPT